MKKYYLIKEIATILIGFLVLFSMLFLFWQNNFRFSKYDVKNHNRKICEIIYEKKYAGMVDDIKYVNEKSKRKVIFLKNQNWVTPLGQYHNLDQIKSGDSIEKNSGSFVIKVFPAGNADSVIELMPNSVIMQCVRD